MKELLAKFLTDRSSRNRAALFAFAPVAMDVGLPWQ
jgi:hypothetical protein